MGAIGWIKINNMYISSDASRLTRNTLVLYMKMVLTVFVSLYTTRKLLAVLGNDSFGLFNLVAGIISLLTFFNGAMSMASQRFMSYVKGMGDDSKQSSILTVSFTMHLIIAVFFFLTLIILRGPIVDGFLKIEVESISVAKKLFGWAAVTTALSIVSVPFEALITANEDMLFFAILGVIESVLKLLAVLVLFLFDHSESLVIYGISMPIVYLILLAVKFVYCRIKYTDSVISSRYFKKSVMQEMGNYAFWSFWGTASSMFANYGQGLLLNRFFGTIVNASQSISAQLSGQLGALSTTMQRAINPFIDKSEGAGERTRMLGAATLSCRYAFFLLLIFYVPIFFNMEYLLGLWLVSVPPLTIVFCKLLFIRNLIEQLYTPLVNAIGAVGIIKRFQLANSILSLLPLLVGFVLFSLGYPPFTLYVIFIVYSILQGLMVVYFTVRLCGLDVKDYIKKVVLKCLGVSIVAFVFGLLIRKLLHEDSFLSNLLFLSLSFIVTVCLIWFWGLSKDNRSFFQSYILVLFSKMKLYNHGK